MIEIGKHRVVPVRKRDRTTKKLVPQFGLKDEPLTKCVASEVWRETKEPLDGHFCRDRGRKLVVGLVDGDVLVLKPKGTRLGEVSIKLVDVYSYCLRTRSLRKQLEKARDKKAKLANRRAQRRLEYAEKRLLRDEAQQP